MYTKDSLFLSRVPSPPLPGSHQLLACTLTRDAQTQEHVCAIRVCTRAQSYLPLCDPKHCSPPGFSDHGVLQARTPAFPPPGDPPDPGIESASLCLLHWQAGSVPLAPPGKPTHAPSSSQLAVPAWQVRGGTWRQLRNPGVLGPVPSPAVGWERKVGGGVLTGVRFEEWGGEDWEGSWGHLGDSQ